ncbi:MAG: peptidoglycan DD-metalloendopeptidase family protein [Hyphomicrobiales bacterium]|nr:peptidoglycan DD-metalloendopeptidase family protein [Hyphomicrobiales bacterium]
MSCVVELLRSWPWPRVVSLVVIASAAAACSSETARFSSSPYASQRQPHEVTGSVQPRAPSGSVQTSTLPPPSGHAAAAPSTGISGGGRGMASYHPGQADAGSTGSVPSPHAQPGYAPSPYHPPAASRSAPPKAAAPTVHVVAPGETLTRIARMHNISLTELARLNNIAPHTKVNIGDRLTVPAGRASRSARAESDKVAQPKSLSAPRGKTEAKASPSSPRAPSVAANPQPEVVAVSTPAADPPASNAARTGGLSFRWPAKGRVIAGFGPKPNGQSNDGVNIALPEGTPIKAAEDGVVAYAGNELKGYGNLVLVRHADGYVTAYAHAKELLVKRGDPIRRGQIIARSGQTGNVDTPQLHFEIRKGPAPIDPMPLLSGG